MLVLLVGDRSEVTAPAIHFDVNLALSLLGLETARMVISGKSLGMVIRPINTLWYSMRVIRDGKNTRVSS